MMFRYATIGFLLATSCSTEPPSVTLTAPVLAASAVPLSVAVSYKGDSAQLRYAWDIKAPCSVTPSNVDTSATIVALGDDCSGKTLMATVRVSYPGGSVEKTASMSIPKASAPPPPPVEPQITITSPLDGTPTPASFRVSGTAVPVEAAQRLHYWVVINPKGEPGFWPQGAAIAPSPPGGDWSVNGTLGGTSNKGQVFNISVVLAENSAHESFTNYLNEGAKTRSYPGKPLPSGARIVVTVSVPKK